jgi:hypothetical protein
MRSLQARVVLVGRLETGTSWFALDRVSHTHLYESVIGYDWGG